jgi:hypothetical protein
MSISARLAGLSALVLLTGCASVGPREPVKFEGAARPAGSERFPNWIEPPDEAMRVMVTAPPKVLSLAPTATGTSGAEKVAVDLGGDDYKIKAKKVPPDLDGVNNAPRKELAAYELQKLFLDPEDYVVPATSLRCIPMDLWREDHGADEKPNIPGIDECQLVLVALWLKDVRLPAVLLDRERFLTEPSYAYHMSNLNVFSYLTEHQDGREGNFLVSNDDRRQVFAIDNGVSFGQPWPFYNWFVPNWDVLRVPAVREDSIDRLRALRREDLDSLLVVAQLEPDADGILQLVSPGPPQVPETGATQDGTTVQFGLTEDEIDDVWERIEDLIEDVDDGELPVF